VEEARLVALGVRARIALDRGLSVIVDVGGGSIEIVLVSQGKILDAESHDVGGIRLLEKVGASTHERVLPLIEGTIRASRYPLLDRIARRKVTRLVGTGGSIETLAAVFGSAGNGALGRITLPRLRTALAALARLTPAERVARYGLRPDRADVILPAGALFAYVGARVRAREVLVPSVGLVDGVLLDVAQAAGREGEKSLETSQTRNAAMAIMRKYDADARHAMRVTALAVSLFDQLRSLHGFSRRDRLLLELAGLLHEVGQFINQSGHHRHAYYILTETPILGLSDSELSVVANVARYHRKAPPDPSHDNYRELTERDRDRVRTLAAILRVADGLDHDHRQRITGVKATPRGAELRLTVRTRGDVTLDELAVDQKGDLFREEFGLRPVVRKPK